MIYFWNEPIILFPGSRMVYLGEEISGEYSTLIGLLVVGRRTATGLSMTPSSGIKELKVTTVSDFSLHGKFGVCSLSVLGFLLP